MVVRNGYKKILVPFDGSKFSQKAIEIAIEMSRKFSASLYLVTIIDISTVNPPGSLLGSQKKLMKTLNAIKSAAKFKTKKILSEKVSICKKNGVDAYYEILEGVPSDRILGFIKKSDIDLVVIGSRGLSGFSKIMALGSASRRVSELSKCPVLIIH